MPQSSSGSDLCPGGQIQGGDIATDSIVEGRPEDLPDVGRQTKALMCHAIGCPRLLGPSPALRAIVGRGRALGRLRGLAFGGEAGPASRGGRREALQPWRPPHGADVAEGWKVARRGPAAHGPKSVVTRHGARRDGVGSDGTGLGGISGAFVAQASVTADSSSRVVIVRRLVIVCALSPSVSRWLVDDSPANVGDSSIAW